MVIAVINSNFAVQAGLDNNTDSILKESVTSAYANLAVYCQDTQNVLTVQNFQKAYQLEAVEHVARAIFKGNVIKTW